MNRQLTLHADVSGHLKNRTKRINDSSNTYKIIIMRVNSRLLMNQVLILVAFVFLTISSVIGQNVDSLYFQKTSKHFDFYSTTGEFKVLDSLAKTLEDNYSRIADHLKTQFDKKIKVYVYPDIKMFHDAFHATNAPEWFVGKADANEIKMVSPLNPGSMHTYASLMQVIVHEFVHTAVYNARGEKGISGLPKWLSEGYAYYEAHQMNDNWRKSIKLKSLEKAPPTWVQLESVSDVEFGNIDGYGYSTIIIEFLVDTYGFDKLVKLIREPENIETIYGLSKGDLEKQWIQYLKTT